MPKPKRERPALPHDHVALYARVSSDKQADRGTIAAQRTYLLAYTKQHNLLVVDEYYDDGTSGTLPFDDRPEGTRLLADAAAGRFGKVLFYKVDRFGRDHLETLWAAKRLHHVGVAIQSATESFDPGTPFGQFQFALLSGLAQLNRDVIIEQLTRGRDRRAADGLWGGGALPLGFMVNEQQHLVPSTRVIEPSGITEAELVIEILTRIAQGSTTVAEAKRLNLLGIPVLRYFTNGRASSRPGQQWWPGRIAALIHNPLYSGDGTLHSKRGPVPRVVPPLVSPALQAQAQAQVRANKSFRRNAAKARLYLLRGMIFCGLCGRRCVGCGGNAATQKYYYRCPDAASIGASTRPRCTGRLVRAVWLEEVVWAYCRTLILHPEMATAALAAHETTQEAPRQRLDAEAQRYRQRLAGQDAERERILTLYRLDGLITVEEMKRHFGVIDQERARLEQGLAQTEAALAQLDQARQPLRTAEAVLRTLQEQVAAWERTHDPEAQRAILEILAPRITIELIDPTPRAGSSQITLRLFGTPARCGDNDIVNKPGISTTWMYSHAQQILRAPTEILSARVKAAQAKVRAAGGHIGRPSRFTPEQRRTMRQQRAAGVSLAALREQYQVSAGYLWALLKDEVPPPGHTA
jgi:site-specific DNA recombinase